MLLTDLKHYKESLEIYYDSFEDNTKLGVADKLLIKNMFNEAVVFEAKNRLYDKESEEWAHRVACGWVAAWDAYFKIRNNNLRNIYK
jgi:cation transport regulator ChaB